jgi:putative addiction module component (TIGR02574 family)
MKIKDEMPPNERVVFAESILDSIDYEDDEIRQSWIIEVQSRMKAVNEGRVKLLDFEGLYLKKLYNKIKNG